MCEEQFCPNERDMGQINALVAHNQRIDKSRPFPYELMWERHDSFQALVEEV